VVEDSGEIPAEVIEDYSSYLDERIEFLASLCRDRKKEEALTLCCVYIESLAQKVYGDCGKGSKRNFVQAALEFGGDKSLSLIHLPSLAEALKGCGPEHSGIEKALRPQVSDRLNTEEEVLAILGPLLTSEQLKLLRDSLWHGTVAAQMYRYFRSALVHEMYTSDGIILGGVTFRGFAVLYPVLQKVALAWKDRLASARS
jgi:hypothetical protein